MLRNAKAHQTQMPLEQALRSVPNESASVEEVQEGEDVEKKKGEDQDAVKEGEDDDCHFAAICFFFVVNHRLSLRVNAAPAFFL